MDRSYLSTFHLQKCSTDFSDIWDQGSKIKVGQISLWPVAIQYNIYFTCRQKSNFITFLKSNNCEKFCGGHKMQISYNFYFKLLSLQCMFNKMQREIIYVFIYTTDYLSTYMHLQSMSMKTNRRCKTSENEITHTYCELACVTHMYGVSDPDMLPWMQNT